MFNIFEKKSQYIGLHINDHALKALQFSQSGKSISIQAYTNAPMGKGMVIDDEFVDQKNLIEFINRSIDKPQKGKFSTNKVILSLPESKSFIRVISMPSMSEGEVENAIMFEAEAYIPMPMDQVYFDWQILSRTDQTMDVLVTASPKVYVDKIISVIEGANLQICGIETEAQSVARALVPPTATEPMLIADLDAFKTALVMVQNAALQFTSSIPLAGNVFTERLAKAMSVTPGEAEKIKRKVGFANTVEYPNLKTQLRPAIEDLAAEIKNILKFHYDHHETHIGQLLLTGGGAKLQHLSEELEPMLADFEPLTVTVANPLQHIAGLAQTDLTPYEALSFTTAIGLALWEVQP